MPIGAGKIGLMGGLAPGGSRRSIARVHLLSLRGSPK